MSSKGQRKCGSLAILALTVFTLAGLPPAPAARDISESIVPTKSKLFEFHSAFWVNLHHFLYVQARARMKTADSSRVAVAQAKNDLEDKKPFAERNGSRDIDAGGHKLHMVVQGAGKPIVILESGLGQGREAWTRVFLDIAKFARVVTYDRAGLGQSEPGPKPRTAEQMATELHTALTNAGLAPPYILIGHSGSGFTVRVFAHRYPKEISGMVLVDPTQEGLTDWIKSNHPEVWQRLEEEQKKNAEGVRDELEAAAISEQQAHNAVPLPNVPVVLLTGMGTDSFRTPDLLAKWLALHNEWLETIPLGKHMFARHSEHFIQNSEPELIIRAIRDVMESLKPKYN